MAGTRRSPSYPRISLDRAIDLARKVYDSAYESNVDVTTAVGLMGYQGKSGPSLAALASLKQYGLMEGRDQALRITSLALRILHPSNEVERLAALKSAVFLPTFYEEIGKQFSGRMPGDQVLKSHLVRNHGFTQGGADDFIRVLKDNRPYMDAPLTSRETSAAEPEQDSQPSIARESLRSTEPAETEEDREILRFRVSPDCMVRISFLGPVSQAALEKTIQYLELAKDNYPET